MGEIPEKYVKAVACTMRILEYRDNTERTLRRKLCQKGYSEEETDYAVRYAVENGYLNEDRMLYHAVRQYALHKHYGKRRIVTELYRQGFSREAIAHGAENGCFDEIDFAAQCRLLLRQCGGVLDQKTAARLSRYGYSYSEMRDAQNTLDSEEKL